MSTTALHVVVGAGAVGTAVAEQLVASGARVRVVTRSGSGPDHPAIEKVAADAADAERLTELCQGAVAVYNCANPPYHQWVEQWPPIADALLAAAERTGAVLATCSNLYGYHPDDAARLGRAGVGLHEDLPLSAPTTKGRVRARMWADALAAHQAGRIRAVETRASDYLGATSASMLGDLVVPRVLAGKTVRVLGYPDVPHAYTYVGDVARMLIIAATDERAWGRAWHVPTHPAHSARQVIDELAATAGVPSVAVRRVSAWMQRALGLVMPVMREMPEVMYQHTRPWLLDSSAAQRTFGLEPTPWQEILTAHVDQYRQAPGRAAAA